MESFDSDTNRISMDGDENTQLPMQGIKFNDAKWKPKWPSCSNFTDGVTISDRDKVSKY